MTRIFFLFITIYFTQKKRIQRYKAALIQNDNKLLVMIVKKNKQMIDKK